MKRLLGIFVSLLLFTGVYFTENGYPYLQGVLVTWYTFLGLGSLFVAGVIIYLLLKLDELDDKIKHNAEYHLLSSAKKQWYNLPIGICISLIGLGLFSFYGWWWTFGMHVIMLLLFGLTNGLCRTVYNDYKNDPLFGQEYINEVLEKGEIK